MEFVATQQLVRQSPRKVRLVANQVKKLSLEAALKQLAVIERKSTLAILKVMKSAIANAMNNHRVDFKDLELKNIIVMQGPTYKRFRPVSRGRAHKILKRSSRIQVILSEKDGKLENGKTGKQENGKAEDKKAKKTDNGQTGKRDNGKTGKTSVKKTKTYKLKTKN